MFTLVRSLFGRGSTRFRRFSLFSRSFPPKIPSFDQGPATQSTAISHKKWSETCSFVQQHWFYWYQSVLEPLGVAAALQTFTVIALHERKQH